MVEFFVWFIGIVVALSVIGSVLRRVIVFLLLRKSNKLMQANQELREFDDLQKAKSDAYTADLMDITSEAGIDPRRL